MTHTGYDHKTLGKYILDKQIGSGGFSVVYKAFHSKTKQPVAIKIINRKTTISNDMINYLETELRLISRFDHPSIVKVYDIIYTEEDISIVMEYLPNGDLQSLIDTNYKFSTADQVRIATEILEGLDYLHSRGIAHRDVKPGNILFDENMHAKLIDFGFSKDQSSLYHTFCGTQLFMAPEIIKGLPYDGRKSDIWAFGVTVHLLANLIYPFDVKSELQYVADVRNNKLCMCIESSGILGWLAKNSLNYQMEERLNAADLLQYVKQQSVLPAISLGKLGCSSKRSQTTCPVPRLKVVPSTPLFNKARAVNGILCGRRANIQRRKAMSLE